MLTALPAYALSQPRRTINPAGGERSVLQRPRKQPHPVHREISFESGSCAFQISNSS
jgi:hypothetical protein